MIHPPISVFLTLSLPPRSNGDKGSCPRELTVPLPILLLYFTEKMKTEEIGMSFGPHIAPVPAHFCVSALVSTSVLLLKVNFPRLAKTSPSTCSGHPRSTGCSRTLRQCLPSPLHTQSFFSPIWPWHHFSHLNIPFLDPASFSPEWPQCSPLYS